MGYKDPANIAAKIGIVGIGLAAAFTSVAHVPEGSPLMRYKSFIMNMSREGQTGYGGCCHLEDGQGNLREERVLDKPGISYRVQVTQDDKGNDLKGGPIWLEIPTHAVLSAKHAKSVCDSLRKDHPNDPDTKTCVSPPVNILWTSSYTADYPNPTIYCYWPKPTLQ